MKACDGCRFCCWSFNIQDIPDEVSGFAFKEAFKHCQYECSAGCSLHGLKEKPKGCNDFECAYFKGADIHRPDTFQPLLESLEGNIGNYIPHIDTKIPVKDVKNLIAKTRSLPAAILIGNEWTKVIIPLDRNEDQSWDTTKEMVENWENLYKSYNINLSDKIEYTDTEFKMI